MIIFEVVRKFHSNTKDQYKKYNKLLKSHESSKRHNSDTIWWKYVYWTHDERIGENIEYLVERYECFSVHLMIDENYDDSLDEKNLAVA